MTVTRAPDSPRFATTRWTMVVSAGDRASPDSQAAMAALCRSYWFPLYAFVRRSGKNAHDAQDLTQAFFQKIIERDLLSAADRERGKFRTFLLTVMKRFLINEYEASVAEKRGGGCRIEPLDTTVAEERYLAEPPGRHTADDLFERRWALTLLERVMTTLREDFTATGRTGDFDVLKPYLVAGRGEIPYAEVAAKLRCTEGAARVATHRLRKRFREVFRAAVADTVADTAEVDAELRHVVEVIARV